MPKKPVPFGIDTIIKRIYNLPMEIIYILKQTDNYKIVNEILKNEFNISSRLRLKLINNQSITLNGKTCSTKENVQNNDEIKVSFNYEEDNSNILPTKMNLKIVYEDEWLLVVNKPAGIAVHPSILHFEDSLSNGIKFYYDSINLKKKIRPVNRLDKNTSGLVVFAKCEYIQEQLIKQMQQNVFKKEYLALVTGHLDNKKRKIDLPIARKKDSIIERCIDEKGQASVTHYEVIHEYENYSLVKCILETGRTHQIRVHFQAIRTSLTSEIAYMVVLLHLLVDKLYTVVA